MDFVTLDAIPMPAANIARGLAALDKALRDKTTVHRAMYRDGLGWVDFVWGDEGKWPPNERGRRKGERGIAHVLEARPRKDGLTGAQTRGLLRRMVRAIAEGKELDRHRVGVSQRVIVGRDGTEVHLVQIRGGNAWALTVFEPQPSRGVEGGALDAASGAFQPTHSSPTPRRPGVGAPSVAAGDIGPSLGRATQGTLRERRPVGAASGLILDASGDVVNGDAFAELERAASESAFGGNCAPPTPAQCKAGNYKVGRLTLHGMRIAIEQPRNTYREGVGADGKSWRNRMAAHYGYLIGTRGADGDGIDVFVGSHPESEQVYVINQFIGGRFDEHKVMLAFTSEDEARRAYLNSYDRGWTGLRSLVPVTLDQLKWWVKQGNKSRLLSPAELPTERNGNDIMKKTYWNGLEPERGTLDAVLYLIRRDDAGAGLLLDALDVPTIMSDADGTLTMDALVVQRARLERTMELMRQAMARQATDKVSPLAVQISDPFLKNGAAHIAVVFELSDGQSISVYFHNPDVTPKKIGPADDLISWKWVLNKKDITIVVAPERGRDLNIREVAGRVMRLAAKNSDAFARANGKRAERMQRIDGLKGEVAALESELARLQKRLEVAKIEAESNPPVPQQNQADESEEAAAEQIQESGDAGAALSIERMAAALVNDPFGEGESEFPAWDAPADVVHALTEDQYLSISDRLEDANYRPESIVFEALRKGSAEDVAEARALLAAQHEAGGLTEELRVRRQALVEKMSGAGAADDGEIEVSGDELGVFPDDAEGHKALRAAADAYLSGLVGQWFPCPVLGGDVEIRRRGNRKLISTSGDVRKLKLVKYIPAMLKRARKVKTNTPYNQADDKSARVYHVLGAPVRIAGESLTARLVVKEDVNGQYHYDLSVLANGVTIDSVAGNEEGRDESQPSTATSNDGGTYPSRLASGQLDSTVDEDGEKVKEDTATLDATEVNVFKPGDKVVDQEGRNYTVMRQDDLRVYVRDKAGQWFHPNHLILASGAKPKRAALDGLADALAEFDDADEQEDGDIALDAARGGSAYVMNLFIEGVDIDADGNPIGELAVEIGEDEDLTTEAGIARALQVAVARAVYDDSMANAEKYPDVEVARVRERAIAEYTAQTSGAPRDMHVEIAKAIAGKDAIPLIRYFVNGNFAASEGVFERATGVKIRRMAAARKEEALKDWAGWSDEQKAEYAQANAQAEAERAAKRAEEQAARDRDNLIAVLNHKKYRREDDSIISAKALIEELVSSGYVRLDEGKRGAAKKWTLWNDATRRGMPLNKNEAEYAGMLLAGLAEAQPEGGAPAAGVTDKAVVSANLATLRPFMSNAQKGAVSEGLSGEESKFFAETIARLAETVKTMPRTYGQDGKGDQAVVYLHYFKGGMDWHVTELDKDGDGTEQAFGLADLGQGSPELGYINLREVVQIGAELDFHWEPKALAAIRGGKATPEDSKPDDGPSIDKRDLLFRAAQDAAQRVGATLEPATVGGGLEIETRAVRGDAYLPVMLSPHGYANFGAQQIELTPGEDAASLVARIAEVMDAGLKAEPVEDTRDTSHLVALTAGLARKRALLAEAKTDSEREARAVHVAQAEKELADERQHLGMSNDVSPEIENMDADALLGELIGEPSGAGTARAFLQSVIDGKADLMDKGLPGKLESIYTEHSSDADMRDLWNTAVNAYTQAMMQMASGAMAA